MERRYPSKGVVIAFPTAGARKAPLRDDLDQRLGAALRMARQRVGKKRSEVAERLGMSADGLSACENGRVRITAALLVRIAESLGISVSSLLTQADSDL